MYHVLKFFQDVTEPVLGSQSYWFAIVLLTIAVRVLLVPLTVKQVRSTRVMQELAPEIKKLQAKHKSDRQKLNEEMMALYKERGFNPMAGCWPLLAQMPFFFALYRVIYSSRVAGEPNILLGKTFFGVPLEQHWLQLPDWGARLGSITGLTIIGLVAVMAVTTYVSQRQLMSKQTAEVNPQQQTLMKIMPFTFFIFGVNVPLAVIIYWVTTNFWSVGQQYVMLRTHPTPAVAGTAADAPKTGGNGEPRRGLGALGNLSMFRGQDEPSPKSVEPGAKNGDAPKAREGKASSSKQQPGKSGSTGSTSSKGGQARSQTGRSGSGGGRKPSSGRPAGKGKASGPRRGKR